MSHVLQICTKYFQWLTRSPGRSTRHRRDMTDDEKIAEDVLILRLLTGFHEDDAGRPVISYLDHDSEEGKRARAALARQLRDGTLVYPAREILARGIDPEMSEVTPEAAAAATPLIWKIEFTSPHRNHKPTWARDRLVIDFIRGWLRKDPNNPPKEDAAIRAAGDHFPLKRSRIAEIWQHHKAQLAESAK
jgi:hypothetical protein